MTLRNAFSLALLSTFAFTACGDSTGPGESSRPLTVTESETGDPTAAVMKVDNGAGIAMSYWTDSGESFGEPTQSLYSDSKGSIRQRIVHSTTTRLPTLSYNESTGESVKIIYGTNRIDFWGFNGSGQFTGGSAITYKDGRIALSDVTSRPAFSGQVSALSNNVSFSVFASPTAGLSGTVQAPESLNDFFSEALSDPDDEYTYNSALLYAAGIMLAGQSSSSGLRTASNARYSSVQGQQIPVFIAYGIGAAVVVGLSKWTLEDIGTIIEDAGNEILTGVSKSKDPIKSLKEMYDQFVEDDLPSFDIPKINRKSITTKIAEAFRTLSSHPNPSGGPPAGSSTVAGAGVDNANTSYPLTGSITGAGQLTVTGTSSNGRTLNVNGTVTSTSFTGTYSGSPGTGSLTGTVAALGKCEQQTASGGQGTFARTYDVGATTGNVTFTYEAYSIPDAFQVIAGGTTVLSTGMISGGGSKTFALNGSSIVSVVVSAPQSGTAWDFSLGCP